MDIRQIRQQVSARMIGTITSYYAVGKAATGPAARRGDGETIATAALVPGRTALVVTAYGLFVPLSR
jgi:hypothetical protein